MAVLLQGEVTDEDMVAAVSKRSGVTISKMLEGDLTLTAHMAVLDPAKAARFVWVCFRSLPRVVAVGMSENVPRLRMLFHAMGLLAGALVFLSPASLFAQPRTQQTIVILGGVGPTVPYDRTNVIGSGFIAGAEYGLPYSAWFGLRPYAELLLTWPDERDETCDKSTSPCEVTAKAGALGTKARLAIPIPYVAPFTELGLGVSVGEFRTLTPLHQRIRDGVLASIPWGLGLSLGPAGELEFKLAALYHPAARQFSASFVFGVTLPFYSK